MNDHAHCDGCPTPGEYCLGLESRRVCRRVKELAAMGRRPVLAPEPRADCIHGTPLDGRRDCRDRMCSALGRIACRASDCPACPHYTPPPGRGVSPQATSPEGDGSRPEAP